MPLAGPYGRGTGAPYDEGGIPGFGNFFAGALGQPVAPAAVPGSGVTPATTTPQTQFPTIPDFGLPDIEQITNLINNLQQQNFQQAAQNRIPGQGGLEQASSARIQQLLNPPEFYPEVDRRSAETAALLGVPGEAPASDARNIRMTREEQLRDIGLGQQFLTGALARNPIGPQFDPSGLVSYMTQLPGQRAQLLTQQQQFAASQQQQRDLALAQMENAYRLAQLQALRSGRGYGGGYNPSYGRGGYGQPIAASPQYPTLPEVQLPTGTGSYSLTVEPNINAAFPQVPYNQGYDLPLDIPINFENLAEPESLYA